MSADVRPPDGSQRPQFARVVMLNEAAKLLLARSLRVNLLALDAMVQSKRGNGSVRGFDEVSSQMLGWSRDLHALLLRLGELSATVVNRTSSDAKDAHALNILARAVELSLAPLVRAAHERLSVQHTAGQLAILQGWRQIDDVLADLEQMAMMACVLSRSAMIEASSAGPELRDQLSNVSQAFNAHAQSVVDILSDLLRAMRKGKVS